MHDRLADRKAMGARGSFHRRCIRSADTFRRSLEDSDPLPGRISAPGKRVGSQWIGFRDFHGRVIRKAVVHRLSLHTRLATICLLK